MVKMFLLILIIGIVLGMVKCGGSDEVDFM